MHSFTLFAAFATVCSAAPQFFPGGGYGFPGYGFPGYGFPGYGFPGNAPGDAYATQLPANTMGSGNAFNKNEVRPGHEGLFAKILKGVA